MGIVPRAPLHSMWVECIITSTQQHLRNTLRTRYADPKPKIMNHCINALCKTYCAREEGT